jgi:hypothetical protein
MKDETPVVPMRPRYSGRLSHAFWKRVGALKSGDVTYALGVALQNLEGQVLRSLENEEMKERAPEPSHAD